MTAGLRPRQVKAIEDVRAAYRSGFVAPVLVAATGFGKTHTAAVIVRAAVERGTRVWFAAHLREILDDTSRKLAAEGIEHGRIMATHDAAPDRLVQVVSVQTAVRRLPMLDRPGLIIVDEAHLAVAETYQKIFAWAKAGPKYYVHGGAKLLHLTATPQRLDGRGLAEVADTIIPTCGTADLIEERLLAQIRYFAPQVQNLSGLASVAGDYSRGDAALLMDRPTITGCAVDHYGRLARGRPAIAFCCSIAHAQNTAAAFVAAGYRAVAVSGESDSEARRRALDDLRAGRIDVVCNCALWVAGVDAPNVSCIILLAPSKSLTKYLQSVGRGLRVADGKQDLIVLDHANMAMTHGLPTDAREWSLYGSARRGKSRDPDDVQVKQCPACFRVVRALVKTCECGHVWRAQGRIIEQTSGDLVEIEQIRAKVESRKQQGAARTLQELIALGVSRGHKNPGAWARHVFFSRKR